MAAICEGHLTFDADPECQWKGDDYWHMIELMGKEHAFHFSRIAGWDELGEGTRGFLTSHGDVVTLHQRMNDLMDDLMREQIYCRRCKIEATILDVRY